MELKLRLVGWMPQAIPEKNDLILSQVVLSEN